MSISMEDAVSKIIALDTPQEPETPEEELPQEEEVVEEDVIDEETQDDETEDEELEEEPEEDSEEEVDEEDEPQEEDFYEIKLADEHGVEQTFDVPASELVEGYLRNQDYVKRRQALNNEHKTKMSEVEKARDEYAKRLEMLVDDDVAEYNDLYNNTQWEQLGAADPAAYNEKRNRLYDLYARIQERSVNRDNIAKERKEREQQELQSRLREQQDILVNAIPNWESEREQVKSYLTSQGVNDFSPFVDAQLALMAYKAKEFDRLEAKRKDVVKQKVAKKVPKVIKPGTQATEEQNKAARVKKAMGRLRQDHSMDAAVEALLARS